jgi:hypothetical protein
MKRFAFLAAIACLCSGVLTGPRRAGFVGQSVNVDLRFPDLSTDALDLGTKAIAAAGTTFTETSADTVTVLDTSIDFAKSGGQSIGCIQWVRHLGGWLVAGHDHGCQPGHDGHTWV